MFAVETAPQPGHVIADVGCGTGSLALLLPRVEPRARIIGLDPDPDVLAVARRKSAKLIRQCNGASAWVMR
jgi:ubiquinone/menaquinone biosynthesis C-methylase UbiE